MTLPHSVVNVLICRCRWTVIRFLYFFLWLISDPYIFFSDWWAVRLSRCSCVRPFSLTLPILSRFWPIGNHLLSITLLPLAGIDLQYHRLPFQSQALRMTLILVARRHQSFINSEGLHQAYDLLKAHINMIRLINFIGIIGFAISQRVIT